MHNIRDSQDEELFILQNRINVIRAITLTIIER